MAYAGSPVAHAGARGVCERPCAHEKEQIGTLLVFRNLETWHPSIRFPKTRLPWSSLQGVWCLMLRRIDAWIVKKATEKRGINVDKVTAGRDTLGDFAPVFAEINDDVLFGKVWSREEALSPKLRSVVTVSTLVAKGIFDSSFEHHMSTAKSNGVSREEMAEILTHAAFYAGWPNAWAAFRVALKLYQTQGDSPEASGAGGGDEDDAATDAYASSTSDSLGVKPLFGLGAPNDAYAAYFTGNSYLNPLIDPNVAGLAIANVTFEPGCRNNWHIHHAKSGGGQILLCTDGRGWYQEWGEAPRSLKPGDAVHIPAGVKHWHGAAADSWFSHLAFEAPGEGLSNEWLEPVDEGQYPHE